jgi:hypothetical protein
MTNNNAKTFDEEETADQKRIEIAKEFVGFHKMPATKWAPYYNDDDATFLKIYENLRFCDEYGYVTIEGEPGDRVCSIEISKFESYNKHVCNYEWDDIEEDD